MGCFGCGGRVFRQEEAAAEPGPRSKAHADVLAKRKIVRARRPPRGTLAPANMGLCTDPRGKTAFLLEILHKLMLAGGRVPKIEPW